MRFAEIFLRLGASLVGWMVIIAYLLWLAVTQRIDCAATGDGLYTLLLFAGPPAACLSLMTLATKPMTDIQAILRWLGVIPALLLPLALMAVFDVAYSVHVTREPLCGNSTIGFWQLAFAPVVLMSMAVMGWACVGVWRSSKAQA